MKPILYLCLLFLIMPSSLYAEELGQGERAVMSGHDFDESIGLMLSEHGFELVRDASDASNKSAFAVRDVGYETLYQTQGRYDFVLYGDAFETPVWIEAINQNSPGSVDEKLPYLFLSALQNVPAQHVILVLGGKGRRKGAMDWVQGAVRDPRWTVFANP